VRLALVAELAGVIGAAICLVLVAVLWLGIGRVSGAIDDLALGVDNGFGRAIAATTAVAGRLDGQASDAGAIASDATQLSSQASPPANAVVALTTRIGRLSDAYRELRIRLGDARESAGEAVASVQRVAQLLPGTRVPAAPIGALAAVDSRLQGVDDSLAAMWPSDGGGSGASQVVTTIATVAATVQGAVADASTAVRGLSTNLDRARLNAAGTISDIRSVLLLAGVVISLLLIWVFVLNVALWQLGRTRRRQPVIASAPSPLAEGPAPGSPDPGDVGADRPAV
jgi:hypothetical protein